MSNEKGEKRENSFVNYLSTMTMTPRYHQCVIDSALSLHLKLKLKIHGEKKKKKIIFNVQIACHTVICNIYCQRDIFNTRICMHAMDSNY